LTVKCPRIPVLLAAACLALSVSAAEVPSLERGRALYENHCMVCHTSKVHRRNPPSAIDAEALRFIVKVWVEEQKLRWSAEDIEDVVQYVNSTYYRFSK
jgi:mono/diheme cytochrome c family protein